ncbi:STAS domain-containing protein [bacterium]|nr:STAS domain-containing protein [bacterium]
MGTLKTQVEGSILIVGFQDVSIIDESRIEAVGTELKELISKSDQEKIVLSFEHVEFMSSAMIGKLVHFGNMCKKEKVALRLCDINPNVKKVFDLMRLDKLFGIDKDVETSMSKLAHGGWFAQ